ncbi:MarR family winged helix-turn-helix transcriptional regulator [Sphingobium boeckii]|uniref:DNA-binding MarR family transcriptional regulator n=1 Tax=Sphingobium boeckii TaxID=1082345 RepID=A0A7W9EF47_9SPHN|nr:MarR family winged helix-turn-helix transcriptional regulator [Sphingobium boeckii]MBB5686689.1 DNA-binding MarR family transcriptional regulator [Sphingobium boeckii]
MGRAISEQFPAGDGFGAHSDFYVEHARGLLTEAQQSLDAILVSALQNPPMRSTSPAQTARRLGRERMTRDNFFPANLTKEPAWPMLVELYRCRIDGEDLSVTGLSFGVGIPLTTGHRWIEGLRQGGYLEAHPSKSDGRSTLIVMTDKGFADMNNYLMSISSAV